MQARSSPPRPIFTYQTRLVLDVAQTQALDAYAALYGRAERSLFASMRSGQGMNDLKREFQPRFGLTSRQFNAVRVGLEGKIDSIEARRPELIAELQGRIKQATKVVAKLALRPTLAAKLHQKKRRLHILQTPLFDFAPMFLDPEVIPRGCHWKDKNGRFQRNWAEIIDSLDIGDAERVSLCEALADFAYTVARLEQIARDCGVEKAVLDQCLHSIEEQTRQLDELAV